MFSFPCFGARLRIKGFEVRYVCQGGEARPILAFLLSEESSLDRRVGDTGIRGARIGGVDDSDVILVSLAYWIIRSLTYNMDTYYVSMSYVKLCSIS